MNARSGQDLLALLLSGALAIVALGCGGEIRGPGSGGPGSHGSPGAPGTGGTGAFPTGAAAAPGGSGVPAAPSDCRTVESGPRRLWRLTATQYDNSIRDLFGLESTFGAGFPADEVVHGFNNNSEAMLVSPLLADKLKSAAQDIAGKAELGRLVPCASGSADESCLRELATKFGERVFRRPLQPTDAERYLALARSAGGFEAGARLMIQAMVQSPHFLYRFELGQHETGTRFVLSDYEIASELSYLLWQTTPDEALLAAARSGRMHTREQVAAQVDLMLQSPRARPVVRAFVFDWLGLSAVTTVPKDTARFPELTNDVRVALLGEAERFVDHVMFVEGGKLSALLTSPITYLDSKLAAFYGTTASGDPSEPIMLPEQQRRGILTLGATMLVHARSNDSSPVHRGRLVRERLLCQPLPPPPPGIVIQPPPLDPAKTTRERYAAHSSLEPCVTCHRLMDPIGLVFEHFDGVGRYRANDNGQPIDASGEIVGSERSDGKFNGSSELIDQLEGSPDVQDCYSLSWLRFAYGLKESAESACVVDRVQAQLTGSDGSMAAIVSVLTSSEQFYTRTGTLELPAPEPDPSSAGTGAEPPKDPGSVAPPDGLDVQVSQNNDWGGGYCKTFALKNTGSAPLTWSVPLEVAGTMSNHWECEVSGATGMVTFTGAQHNATLQPGMTGQFGFCANR